MRVRLRSAAKRAGADIRSKTATHIAINTNILQYKIHISTYNVEDYRYNHGYANDTHVWTQNNKIYYQQNNPQRISRYKDNWTAKEKYIYIYIYTLFKKEDYKQITISPETIEV